jgi:hypothetical protein
MHDEDGPTIAAATYEQLFVNNKIELDSIPHALDAAVEGFRASRASPSRWATFIHMGA